MSSERWGAISRWHNAWLRASPDERARLRARLAELEPEAAAEVLDLAAASDGLAGFLETPAFELAAPELAADSPRLAVGQMVGPYRVSAPLAQGGMAEVYRAKDVRLNRDVALKLVAPAGESDPQRAERFLLEARTTASLDHPNVVRVFDVGVFEGTPYLVSELLEGETLRARLSGGPLASAEAVRVAAEVTSGLVAAHGAGVVHRDLKPENMFLTRSGVTKILDFGIAKLAQDPAGGPALSTLTGVLVGTAGYVAPEQVRGEAVDGRTDLFALGVVLFEMLAGEHPFAREHTVDTLHAIVHDTPPDLVALRPEVPAPLAAVVSRMLQKQPDARFQSAADLAWALENVAPSPIARTKSPGARHRPRPRLPALQRAGVGLTLIAGATLGGVFLGRISSRGAPAPAGRGAFRSTWSLPAGLVMDSAPAVSPDGRSLAFTAIGAAGRNLYTRSMDSLVAAAIAGTEGAQQPFWSPDGRWLGFFARGRLMKVAVGSGAPVVISGAPDARGGTWSRDGTIVFAPDRIGSGLSRVSANGGPVELATLLDTSRGENSHRWPEFLPDGIHFLYFVRSVDDDRRGVYVGSVDRAETPPQEPLFHSETDAVYAPLADGGGVLLSVAQARIVARRFDPERLAVLGDPQTLGLSAGGVTPYHPAMLGASADLLALAESPVSFGSRLCVVGRDGTGLRCFGGRETQGGPRLSRDGRWLARGRLDAVRGDADVWVEDLARGTLVRVTTTPGIDTSPVWSADGRRLAYMTRSQAQTRLAVAAADGTGVLREIACPGRACAPTDWSPDGGVLAVNVDSGRGDVWLVPADAASEARPLLSNPFAERDARFTPDGRFIAYVSEESGRPEVSVRSLVGPPQKVVVSSGGGDQPVWRRDGRELFYVDLTGRLRNVLVSVDASARLVPGPAGTPSVPPIGRGHFGAQYDVSNDGRRVYFFDRAPEPPSPEFHLVQDWAALLR